MKRKKKKKSQRQQTDRPTDQKTDGRVLQRTNSCYNIDGIISTIEGKYFWVPGTEFLGHKNTCVTRLDGQNRR